LLPKYKWISGGVSYMHLCMWIQVFKWLVSTQDVCIEITEVENTSEDSACANKKSFFTYIFWVVDYNMCFMNFSVPLKSLHIHTPVIMRVCDLYNLNIMK
jgi:hypothetical protein